MRNPVATRSRASVRAADCSALLELNEASSANVPVNTGTVSMTFVNTGSPPVATDLILGTSPGARTFGTQMSRASVSAMQDVFMSDTLSVACCMVATSVVGGPDYLLSYGSAALRQFSIARTNTTITAAPGASLELTMALGNVYYALYSRKRVGGDLVASFWLANRNTGVITSVQNAAVTMPAAIAADYRFTVAGPNDASLTRWAGTMQQVLVTDKVALDEYWLREQLRRANL